jgi:hypothetical protein
MNWKLLTIGLGLVVALLVAASVVGTAVNTDIPGPVYIFMPTAQLSNVLMYGWVYSTSTQPGEYAPVIAQSVGSVNAPSGLTISKTVYVPLPNPLMPSCPSTTIAITAELAMSSAQQSNVFMYATNLTSTSGSLSGVTIIASEVPYVVNQTITSGTMNNLGIYAFYVSVGSLSYTGLTVTVTPALIECNTTTGTVTLSNYIPSS